MNGSNTHGYFAIVSKNALIETDDGVFISGALLVNYPHRDKETGEYVDHLSPVLFKASGRTAERLNVLSPGDSIAIDESRIKTRIQEEDGVTRYTTFLDVKRYQKIPRPAKLNDAAILEAAEVLKGIPGLEGAVVIESEGEDE